MKLNKSQISMVKIRSERNRIASELSAKGLLSMQCLKKANAIIRKKYGVKIK